MFRERHAPAFRIIFTDLVILNAIIYFFIRSIKGYELYATRRGEHYLFLLILFNLLWVLINTVATQYCLEVGRSWWREVKKIILHTAILAGLVSIFAFLLKSLYFSRMVIFGTIAAFFVGQLISHSIFWWVLRWRHSRNPVRRVVIVVGSAAELGRLSEQMSRDPAIVYDIEPCLARAQPGGSGDCHRSGVDLAAIERLLSRRHVDELFISGASICSQELGPLMELADAHGVRIRLILADSPWPGSRFSLVRMDGMSVLNVGTIPLDHYYNWLYKQVFDRVFAFLALLVLAPLLALVGLLVKLTSPGPLLFVPERVGMGGKVFRLYKFRSMYHEAGGEGGPSARVSDPRVTPLGRFLRKYNLDELPQFYNVLKGDMSVVGPRPHRIRLDQSLQARLGRYMLRHYVKPGVTGWAQVHGWRGPTETDEQQRQRVLHDLWYLSNWTFWLDIKIIFLTLFGKRARQNAF